ncbi:MAG: hypothetical protein KGV44_05905 [Flavobacteriaceae bacterium]|nr:hypothetical protein [Flavobacteriaceae bacterium]
MDEDTEQTETVETAPQTETPKPLGEVTRAEFNEFKKNKNVSEERKLDIARKVAENEKLSQKEKVIYKKFKVAINEQAKNIKEQQTTKLRDFDKTSQKQQTSDKAETTPINEVSENAEQSDYEKKKAEIETKRKEELDRVLPRNAVYDFMDKENDKVLRQKDLQHQRNEINQKYDTELKQLDDKYENVSEQQKSAENNQISQSQPTQTPTNSTQKKGVFGTVYTQFKGKVKEAVSFLLKQKEGEAIGVFNRKGFGDIDLPYGSHAEKYGLEHIVEKHIKEQNDFESVEHATEVINDVIENGKVSREKWDKVIFEKDGYKVIISKNVRDKKGNVLKNKNWVVTSFDSTRSSKNKTNSTTTVVTPDSNKGSRAVASEFVSADKDTKQINEIETKRKKELDEVENFGKPQSKAKSGAKVFYANTANHNGEFTKTSQTKSDQVGFIKLTEIDENTAEFEFNTEDRYIVGGMYDVNNMIETSNTNKGRADSKHNNLITTKKGIAKKENGKWVIKEKGEVKYIDTRTESIESIKAEQRKKINAKYDAELKALETKKNEVSEQQLKHNQEKSNNAQTKSNKETIDNKEVIENTSQKEGEKSNNSQIKETTEQSEIVVETKTNTYTVKNNNGKLEITAKYGGKKINLTTSEKAKIVKEYKEKLNYQQGKEADLRGHETATPQQIAETVAETSENAYEVAMEYQKSVERQKNNAELIEETKESAIAQALSEYALTEEDAKKQTTDAGRSYTWTKSFGRTRQTAPLDKIAERAVEILRRNEYGADVENVVSTNDILDFIQTYQKISDYHEKNKGAIKRNETNIQEDLKAKFKKLTGLNLTDTNAEIATNIKNENNYEKSEKSNTFDADNIEYNENNDATTTRMDKSKTMGRSSSHELVGGQQKSDAIKQTAKASNNGGSKETTLSIEEREELESRGIDPDWNEKQFDATLKENAQKNGVWLDSNYLDGYELIHNQKASNTKENDVYLSKDGKTVLKVNNLHYAKKGNPQQDLNGFIDRIEAHNTLFPNVAYTIEGYAYNQHGEVSIVLSQPFVKAERNATHKEIENNLSERGFKKDGTRAWSNGHEVWSNGKYEIFDARPANVIVDKNGTLRYIDTYPRSVESTTKSNTENDNNLIDNGEGYDGEVPFQKDKDGKFKSISETAFNALIEKLKIPFKKAFKNLNVVTDWGEFTKRHKELKGVKSLNDLDVTKVKDVEVMKTPKGVIYGAKLSDGTIYINPEHLNANTPIHEFSHLWEQLMPEQWAKGVEMFKNTNVGKKLFAQLKEDGNYEHLTDEQIWSEAVNTYIGNLGEKKYHANSKLGKFAEWVKDTFRKLGGMLGIGNLKAETKFKDFANGVLNDLMGGKEIKVDYHKKSIVKRIAKSVSQAQQMILDLVGKPLTNKNLGITATISKKAVKKFGSDTATKQSVSNRLHAMAVANIDHLFENATIDVTHPDNKGRKEVAQTHRLGSVMFDAETKTHIPVMITVFEYHKDGNKIYSVEAVDVDNKVEDIKMKSAGQSTAGSNAMRQVPIADFVAKIKKEVELAKENYAEIQKADTNEYQRESTQERLRGQELKEQIEILEKLGISKSTELKSDKQIREKAKIPEGEETPLGFVTEDGEVWLNRDKVAKDTPIHEFGHLWIRFVKKHSKAVYERGMQLIEQTEYYQRIKDTPNKTKEQLLEEALAQAIGEKGVKILSKSKKAKFQRWFNALFRKIANGLGLRSMSAERLSKLTFEQFTDLASAEILGGKNLHETQEIIEANKKKGREGIEFIIGREQARRVEREQIMQKFANDKEIEKAVKQELTAYIQQRLKDRKLSEVQNNEIDRLTRVIAKAKTKNNADRAFEKIDNIIDKVAEKKKKHDQKAKELSERAKQKLAETKQKSKEINQSIVDYINENIENEFIGHISKDEIKSLVNQMCTSTYIVGNEYPFSNG